MRRPKEVPLEVVVEQLEVPEAERPNVRELLRLLGRLPFNQRAALTMRELEGRSHVEIAETLGVTVPAAEALIGRARRALRSQAAAIRGLAVVQLPQTLRSLFARGEAAGGAVGSTAAVKAAALIAAGAVAGGVALAPDRAAPRSPAAPIAALVEATPVHAAAVSRRGRSTVHATLRRRIAAASRRARASQPPATWTGRARLDPADADSAKTAPAPAAPATGPRDGGQGGGQAASLAASAPAAPAAPTTPVSDVATAAPSAAAPVTKTVEDTLAAVQPPSLPPATPAPSVPQPPAAPTVPGP
jgi:hypothetical protein